MIGWAELVFDDDYSAFDIARKNIDGKVADRDFGALKLKITKLERVRQEYQVFGFGEPGGEIPGLMSPRPHEAGRTRDDQALGARLLPLFDIDF